MSDDPKETQSGFQSFQLPMILGELAEVKILLQVV
jgi:hypothetical protein